MAIPKYQIFMYPLLELLSDGKEHKSQDVYTSLSWQLQLSDDEKSELLPSGKQPVYKNRIAWAKTYLNKAGLIQTVRRGVYTITSRGQELVNDPEVDQLSNADLMKFEQFRQFKGAKPRSDSEVNGPETNNTYYESLTPQEQLDWNYHLIKKQVSTEILERIKDCTPEFFERLVVELLVSMGYGGSIDDAGKAIGKSGDEGIDGIIKEDALGLDVIYIQAKRWEAVVGRPEIQRFSGSLEGKRAHKGVFLTTSSFSQEARDYVYHIEKKIILINGESLSEYMYEYGVGVSPVSKYIIKNIDTDYFTDK